MSLLHAKVLGQEGVDTFTEERMIVPDQSDKPKLLLYEPLKKNQTKTFAPLFEVVKNDCKKQCTTQRCKWPKAGLQCSAMCTCHQQNNDESRCVNR